MDYKKIIENNTTIIILIPAIIALLVALIPTLKYQWPLSWDIYYHVHISKLYLEHGFTFWDSLTYAPYGRPIFYPPLFHYLLASLALIFKVDLFQISRYIQPLFAFLLVFSFTYVAKELYNWKIAFIAGFFLLFTSVFHRSILPIPETMALIMFPLAVYFYYVALEGKGTKYAIFAGIISGLMMLTHNLTALIMLGVVLLYTLSCKFRKQDVHYKPLWIFLAITLILACLWWGPLILQYGFVFNNPQSVFEGPIAYLIILAKAISIAGLFALLWLFVRFKGERREKLSKLSQKEILIIIWALFPLVISFVYLFGVSILIDRIFNFLVFPVMIMAALGLESIRLLENKNKIYVRVYQVLVVLVIISSVISAFYYVSSTKMLVNDSQRDLAQWFNENGDKQGVVMSLTEGVDPVIVSVSRQPVSTGGYQPGMVKVLDRDLYYSGNYTREDVMRDKIRYFVESSPIPHPSYFTLVYQNKDYKVWRVDT